MKKLFRATALCGACLWAMGSSPALAQTLPMQNVR